MSSGLMSTCSLSFKKRITCFSSTLVSSCGALSIEAAVALFDVAQAYDTSSFFTTDDYVFFSSVLLKISHSVL